MVLGRVIGLPGGSGTFLALSTHEHELPQYVVPAAKQLQYQKQRASRTQQDSPGVKTGGNPT